MIYNEKYDRWITNNSLIFRYDSLKDKLILCKQVKNTNGYITVRTKIGMSCVHRVLFETFVHDIPDNYQIDHINTIRDDNRLENLRCVSVSENKLNPLTRINMSNSKKGKKIKRYPEFKLKFEKHFNTTFKENRKLYNRELCWFVRHGKCRWEV